MTIKEIRALSQAELKEKLIAIKKHLSELEFKRHSTVEKPHLFKQARKDIARILTVLNETSPSISPKDVARGGSPDS